MDKFDKFIKDQLEQHEVPFNEAHWNEMDAKLDAVNKQLWMKKITVAASVVAVIAIAAYFIMPSYPLEEQTTLLNNEVLTEKNTNDEVVKTENSDKFTSNTPEKPTNSTATNEENAVELMDNNESSTSEEQVELHVEDIKQKEVQPNNNSAINETAAASLEVHAEVVNPLVCQGENISFLTKTNVYNLSYSWDFGDGTTSNLAQPKHVYEQAGDYTVVLVVTDARTKEVIKKKLDGIKVLAKPNKDIVYTEEAKEHDDNKFLYPATVLKVKDDNIKTYYWKTADGRESTSASPKFVFENKGIHQVKVMLTHQSGCMVEFTQPIEITLGMDLLAPSGFIPNSSIEENQTFIPKALLGWDITFEMMITDKNGKLVYKTTDSAKPWNGRLNNNGELLPNDIYLWKVVTYDAQGNPYHHAGTIQLMTK